eukprot:TRINITY_DN2098_c0_g1_i10.p1 TRINITY_DN2098_c0_g1~~TRINITY_DN2098_c0_g1_i10.p1  ORF type:complete len:492 (+),score=99.00 TRINITY_DN2098_c0_g1_i10:422-1897(+)
MTRLQQLSIGACKRGVTVSLRCACECAALRELEVVGTETLKDAGVLSQLTGLTVLRLDHCNLTDITLIPKLPVLTELYLRGNCITSLPKTPSLSSTIPRVDTLDLAENKIEALATILPQLQLCRRLEELHVAGNPFAQSSTESSWTWELCAALPRLVVLDSREVNRELLSQQAAAAAPAATAARPSSASSSHSATPANRELHSRHAAAAEAPAAATSRPTTATARRPSTPLRPSSATSRPTTPNSPNPAPVMAPLNSVEVLGGGVLLKKGTVLGTLDRVESELQLFTERLNKMKATVDTVSSQESARKEYVSKHVSTPRAQTAPRLHIADQNKPHESPPPPPQQPLLQQQPQQQQQQQQQQQDQQEEHHKQQRHRTPKPAHTENPRIRSPPTRANYPSPPSTASSTTSEAQQSRTPQEPHPPPRVPPLTYPSPPSTASSTTSEAVVPLEAPAEQTPAQPLFFTRGDKRGAPTADEQVGYSRFRTPRRQRQW